MSRDTTDIANELLAENAVLKGQLAQRDAQIAALASENVALKSWADIRARSDDALEQECYGTLKIDWRQRYLAELKTPATDAAANALRVEGVNHAGKMVMAMLNHQDKGVGMALEVMAQVEMNYIKPAGGSVAE